MKPIQRTKALLASALWLAASLIEAVPAQAQQAPVSLVFAGDIVLDDTAGALIAKGQDPFSSFSNYFKGADIRLGNLECVVATTGSAWAKASIITLPTGSNLEGRQNTEADS